MTDSIIKYLSIILFTIFIANYCNAQTAKVKQSAFHLDVEYQEAGKKDTLALCLINRFYRDRNIFRTRKYFAVLNQKGFYSFDIDVSDNCGYFILQTSNVKHSNEPYRDILQPYFWEKGDSIKLQLSNEESQSGTGIYSDCKFSGNGSDKYTLRFKALYEKKETLQDGRTMDTHTLVALKQLSLLESFKAKVSNLSYNVLKADLIFSKAITRTGGDFSDTLKRYNTMQGYPVGFNLDDLTSLTSEGIAESKEVLLYLFRKYNNDSFIANGKLDYKWIFDQEKLIENKRLRDELIVYGFTVGRMDSSRDSLIREAKNFITDPDCKSELEYIQSINSKRIYNYALQDTRFNTVKLDAFKGSILVIDFWIPGCGPCEDFYKTVVVPLKKLYKDKDVTFISVTGDRDKSRWQKALKSGLYSSDGEINLCGTTKYSDDPFFKDYSIVKFPTVMLFDQYGNLVDYDSKRLYNAATLKQLINSLQK
ncbi:TlpA family protein disulfide reductase [Mucilaginibacter sp. SMC90]|uniref:TlpA family protein disulfide reductase n=1 Tax=Mucilaginibacter sp. SMC90 TaxID=2929803 RepID=UPI001FB2D9C6|nr:TlpA disulfide reductase family protein [Mucilaginibacter sp. SMC90]UOE51337.1 TlpA family protein disulfide reductase [Mucilaginibacter sp. SMC90]